MMEQVTPIIETLQRRLQTPLPDRDKLALANAINQASTMGARVAYASILANAAEAGVELPANLSLRGLQDQDFWPSDD
jgi:hypothetical protein